MSTLKMKPADDVIPTVGFSVESFRYENTEFTVYVCVGMNLLLC